MAAAPITDASVYADFSGLDSLKRAAGAKDPSALREVARQFESLFARMMIKSMRDAVGPDPIFGSDQEKMYQGMFDDQLSVDLTRGRGLGLADMLVRQLQRAGVSSGGAQDQAGAAGAPDTGTSSPGSIPVGARGTSSTPPTAGRISAPAAIRRATQAAFVRSVWPHAAQAGQRLGVDPRSLVAQAALETNWGQDVPHDPAGGSSHNLFGIKTGADWSGSSVAADTLEFSGSAPRRTVADFRSYDGAAQSFDDYTALLRGNPRYAAALNTGNDVQAFATALQRGGYATDPDYARKLNAVAQTVASLGTPGASEGAPLKFASSGPINVNTRTL